MMEFLLMTAVLAPWAAYGGMLHVLLVILERKPAGRKILLWLLAAHAISTAGLFFGPNALRQFDLEFRCIPRLFLIAVFFLSGAGVILGAIVLFFKGKQTRWLERSCVLLSGVMLFGMGMYCSLLFTILSHQTESIGSWNGEKVVMIAVEGVGQRCYEYHGPVVMGKYLGTVLAG